MSEAASDEKYTLDEAYFNANRIMLSNIQMDFLDNIIVKLNSGPEGLLSA